MNDEEKKFLCTKLEKCNRYLKIELVTKSNPTNGDLIQELFSGLEVEFVEDVPLVRTNLDGTLVTFCASWWNAPYTGKGGER